MKLYEENPYRPDRIPSDPKHASARPSQDTLRSAINICLRSHATAESPPEEFTTIPARAQRQAARNAVSKFYRPIEQDALYVWAKAQRLMLSNKEFTAKWKEGGEAGETENQAYFDANTNQWFKRNDLTYHGTYLEFFYRIQLHNVYFPEAPLSLEGFVVDRDGMGRRMLKPIISQPHVSSEVGATAQEVDTHMASLGFQKIPGTAHDYYNPRTGVRVEDLHDENVLKDEQGDLFVVDPVLYLDDEGKSARIDAAGPLVFESLAEYMLSNDSPSTQTTKLVTLLQ